ncbi:uncharacterized protein GIQ15_03848 [Arthroderma uncinatum]|uniref:uncharacterized protein n=1 Tax=Arthroderma uncinatum TaxID=74035 RepID=UPI00144AB833|nr:uncharacterized protein GIQ15_03848 [Arthroderma uncinatum]KAF3481089.1 hypothetical protein GIQ15_03848 [Arthroderma uncinatum]
MSDEPPTRQEILESFKSTTDLLSNLRGLQIIMCLRGEDDILPRRDAYGMQWLLLDRGRFVTLQDLRARQAKSPDEDIVKKQDVLEMLMLEDWKVFGKWNSHCERILSRSYAETKEHEPKGE